MTGKKKNNTGGEKAKRKVRSGAMHKTREQLAADRSAGFSRRMRMATTHRLVTTTGRHGEPVKSVLPRALGNTLDVSELRMLPARPPWGFPRPDMANERKRRVAS